MFSRTFISIVVVAAVSASVSDALATDTYDMGAMLSQPNPFASTRQYAPPSYAPAPASVPVYSYAAGAGRLYDINVLLRQPNPFAAGGFQPLPRAAPVTTPIRPFVQPVVSPVAAPVVAPQYVPAPVAKMAVDSGAVGDVKAEEDTTNDPLEPMNRVFFSFNQYLQDYLLSPIATAYNWLPASVRGSISGVLDNVKSPVVLANDILQFEPRRAWQTTERMVINTTAGVGGLFDVADYLGVPKHKEDFGQTLAVWGVDEWFYVVLPLLGPSSPRDAFGKMFVDSYFDPLSAWLGNTDRDEINWTLTGFSAIDEYAGVVEELQQIKITSIDYYAAIRSMYRQKRESDIKNGKDLAMPAIPDLYDELDNMDASGP